MLAVWIGWSWSAVALAQDEPEPEPGAEGSEFEVDLDELAGLSLDGLLNLEVRAASTLAQTAREAPSLVSVVSRDQIRDFGWTSINDVLYRQAGFVPSRDYDRRTVSSRGLYEGWNNNHLLMLIDGVPVNDNLYGTAYTWELTPLFLMQSMEIVRGPGSALYGSNATNGVLSLNTLTAAEFDGQAAARVRVGTQGHQTADVVAATAGDALGVVVGIDYFSTDGYSYPSTDLSERYPKTFDIRDGRSSYYLFGKVEGQGSLEGLQLQIHQQGWDFQTGHGWLFQVPDFAESMKENRLLGVLSYRRDGERLNQFYAVRYQRHGIDWNMRYYPDDAFEGFYPSGLWEYLRTHGDDVLGKGILTAHLPRGSTFLVGVDTDLFWYTGDDEHYSNVDLSVTFEPYPDGEMHRLDPWLEWIDDRPMVNLGAYTQFSSGQLFGDHLTVTAGARYDRLAVSYVTDVAAADAPTDQRVFEQLSPRLGLVARATDDLTVKLLVGRAFRAPTPTELAGANTFTLASNIEGLQPEEITTVELGTDWRIAAPVTWRIDGFGTQFDDFIGYSPALNLSTNLLSATTWGAETEVLFQTGLLGGFANYAYAVRSGEDAKDDSVAAADTVTWVPAHVANAGLVYRRGKATGSIQGHFQGPVARRDSDYTDADGYRVADRGETVAPWVGLDLRAAYRPWDAVELELIGQNLLDGVIDGAHPELIKNFPATFDYRADGLRVLAGLTFQI
ncbi:MAG: TonB-dependent receptor [Myxococcota bacterium]